MINTYLHPLVKDIPLSATDGTEWFEPSLFPGGMVGRVGTPPLPNKPPRVLPPTGPMMVTSSVLIENGPFLEIFGSLGEDRVRWTRCQVVRFIKDHLDQIQAGDCGNFFELKYELVARIIFAGAGRNSLMINVLSLEESAKWFADFHHMFFTLQPLQS